MGTIPRCVKQAPWDGAYGRPMPTGCVGREEGPGTRGEAARLLHSQVILSCH